ncbi:hypothetical protein ACIBG6_25765 [Streptomyces sp. NPDC050842]|uniref:hypothetical protein n=1 Tax=Streptomyces sp. NPDC050842 TaxID=3365636 RepID=UPI00378FB6EF
MSGALVEPLTSSPLRGLLRLRLGSRVDRALVFLATGEEPRVACPRHDETCPYRSPSLTMVGRRAFERAYWVSLVEHDAVVDLHDHRADTRHGGSTRVSAAWWVSDPALVARERLAAGDVRSWIAHDAGRRGVRADAVRMEFQVPEVGISYRIGRSLPLSVPEPSQAADMPFVWGDERRAAYRFYREAVAQGPYSLAGLWLLHHPDQAREVLDWTVQNRSLLSDQAEWERSLVALLQGLGAEDRGFIGVKLAELLSGMGIPQADETLRRVDSASRRTGHRTSS